MRVKRAEEAGACYGVQRALNIAESIAQKDTTAYTLGPLIHNPSVVESLEAKNVLVAQSVEDIAPGETVVIRSHGVTPDVRQAALDKGLVVRDATCPHVARAQKAAENLAKAGCQVIVVGEAGHPEVAGLEAYARKYTDAVDVVGSVEDIPSITKEKVGVVVQTTQTRELLDSVVAALQEQGFDPVVKDTVCLATKQRQQAALVVAQKVDAMVVIGGRNSSNTTRLAEICQSVCDRTYHIESVDEIDPAWFQDCSVVGVTAGASTPEYQIRAAEEFLAKLPEASCE